ncbi:NADH-quinone oxidoreductase subunit J [Dongia deserti]|uniref:NADH-quinone oxidoreductase subunit J n=1 Tax=Dongia deserti TaxID=2268030 RepID=UPI000E65CC95|nr:NADH-quinone oxidoreductase subunit J [Dongia deserti]
MIVQALSFYVFAAVLIVSGVLVVANRNPVYSVLFLILTFFNAAGLFVLLGAEFLAMMLVVVYVGAVAVLFLFVVMMLDINFAELRQGFVRYAGIGAVVGIVLVAEIIFVVSSGAMSPAAGALGGSPMPAGVTNTEALGNILYTDYFYLFQAAGVVLLIAMIGAIVLTHREREGVRRQRIAAQLARDRRSVEIKKVPTGTGI